MFTKIPVIFLAGVPVVNKYRKNEIRKKSPCNDLQGDGWRFRKVIKSYLLAL